MNPFIRRLIGCWHVSTSSRARDNASEPVQHRSRCIRCTVGTCLGDWCRQDHRWCPARRELGENHIAIESGDIPFWFPRARDECIRRLSRPWVRSYLDPRLSRRPSLWQSRPHCTWHPGGPASGLRVQPHTAEAVHGRPSRRPNSSSLICLTCLQGKCPIKSTSESISVWRDIIPYQTCIR